MTKFRRLLAISALVGLLSAVPVPSQALDSASAATAKLADVSEQCQLAVQRYWAVDGCETALYLVEFESESAQSHFDHYHLDGAGFSLQSSDISGYELDPLELADLARQQSVQSISRDIEIRTMGSQSQAPWHLDRIDQASSTLDQTYNYPDNAQGSGVVIYIVDTGINTTHSEFTGRLGAGYSSIGAASDVEDCNGHGTHVAGLAAGTQYGPAKAATITPVRVLDCNGSGTLSSVLMGLEWIADNTLVGQPAVVNMSLGGDANPFLDNAIASLTSQGLAFVVAAGNSTADACNTSPARVPGAITVASSDQGDSFSSFSNLGSCVDIVAPGGLLPSAWIGGATAAVLGSGTSMASGLVAGLVATQMSFGYQTPGDLSSALTSNALSGVLTSVPAGTPNLLLQNTIAFASPAATPSGTQADITVPQDSTPVSVAPITDPAPGGGTPSLPLVPIAPAAPLAVVSGNSATLTWSLPSAPSSPITYQVLKILSGSTVISETTLTAEASSFLFENMAAGVVYTAQVALANSTGLGAYSLLSSPFSFEKPRNAPDAGEFSAWTKLLANGNQVKFYAKYPQVGQKIQFMVQRPNGSYRELAWLRVDADDLTETGEYQGLTNGIYFVRTVNLNVGKNRLRILVDGQMLGATRTYSLRS